MPRKSKFNNRKTRCLSNHIHDSRLEAGYCNRLLAMKQSGEIANYECQVKYVLAGDIKHIVDFLVIDNGAHYEVHETKGYFTATARMKKKLFEEKYPNIKYIIIRKERSKSCQKRKISNPGLAIIFKGLKGVKRYR